MSSWDNSYYQTEAKICPVCKEFKSLSSYYHRTGAKDGHQIVCKACYNEKVRKKGTDRFDRFFKFQKYET